MLRFTGFRCSVLYGQSAVLTKSQGDYRTWDGLGPLCCPVPCTSYSKRPTRRGTSRTPRPWEVFLHLKLSTKKRDYAIRPRIRMTAVINELELSLSFPKLKHRTQCSFTDETPLHGSARSHRKQPARLSASRCFHTHTHTHGHTQTDAE